MHGINQRSGSLFSDGVLEVRIRPDNPLRTIREIVSAALAASKAASEAGG
jgi:hypothetical protein